MHDIALTDLDFIADMVGPSEPYVVSWDSNFVDDQLIITFSCSPPILGGLGEILVIEFINVNAYKSVHLIPISSNKIFKFEIPEVPPSATSQTAKGGASYTFIFTMGISIGISLLTGGSMELMWSLANTLQIIFFFSMLNLYYSSDLLSVFSFMSYSNFDNPITSYISKGLVGGLNLITSPVNGKFSSSGFNSTDIISNSMDKIMIILLLILLILILV